MGVRRSVIVILAVVVGAATATVVEGQGPGTTASGTSPGVTSTTLPPHTTPSGPVSVPSSERTYPQVRPTTGKRLTRFTLTFTLREALGTKSVLAADYRVQVSRPPQTSSSCAPPQPPIVDSGTAGTVVRVQLTPPAHGWCLGRHRATVFLQRTPYCPPGVEGQPTACPAIAIQDLDTGGANFTVRPKAHRHG